jgi:tetratricopeptide (TPR) repeat protein
MCLCAFLCCRSRRPNIISRRISVVLALPAVFSVAALCGNPDRRSAATVSVGDLNVPSQARKEYQKASIPIQKEDWAKAKEHLLRAVEIYPAYAAAYNDLGAVYARLGDTVHEREALQKAIRVDDHFVPAYINLAKLAVAEHDFPEAERMLTIAVAADPHNPQSLMLLANVELLGGHFALAISHCQQVHVLPHDSQALVHYIAARALQQENKPADALTELQTFLNEAPAGPDTDKAQQEMTNLQLAIATQTREERDAALLP